MVPKVNAVARLAPGLGAAQHFDVDAIHAEMLPNFAAGRGAAKGLRPSRLSMRARCGRGNFAHDRQAEAAAGA